MEKSQSLDQDEIKRITGLLAKLIERIEQTSTAAFLGGSRYGGLTLTPGSTIRPEKLGDKQRGAIRGGRPVETANQYYQPVILEEEVVGCIVVHIAPDDRTDFFREVTETYAYLISHELELAEKKSSLEAFSEQLTARREQLKRTQIYNNNLLRITSHDLSSPLSAVSGYLELMNECLQDDTKGDRIENYHQRIQGGVQDVMQMLKRLSDVNKIESGEVSLDMVELNLCWLVQEVCDLEESTAIAKGVDLSFVYAPECPVYVRADMGKLKRVIRNLVGNAIKYMDHEGQVRVGLSVDDDTVYVQVKDNGPGIAAADQDKIFAPFVKLSNNKSNSISSGLGLYIASYFVNMMEGDITVQSEVGEGSAFTVTLPRIESPLFESHPLI